MPRALMTTTTQVRPFSKTKLLFLVWIGLFVAGMFAISYTHSGQQMAFGANTTAPAPIAPMH